MSWIVLLVIVARLFPNRTYEPALDEKPQFGAACNDVSPDDQLKKSPNRRRVRGSAVADNDVSLAEEQRARAEYDAGIAKLRQMQQSLPACAEGYTRLASIKRLIFATCGLRSPWVFRNPGHMRSS